MAYNSIAEESVAEKWFQADVDAAMQPISRLIDVARRLKNGKKDAGGLGAGPSEAESAPVSPSPRSVSAGEVRSGVLELPGLAADAATHSTPLLAGSDGSIDPVSSHSRIDVASFEPKWTSDAYEKLLDQLEGESELVLDSMLSPVPMSSRASFSEDKDDIGSNAAAMRSDVRTESLPTVSNFPEFLAKLIVAKANDSKIFGGEDATEIAEARSRAEVALQCLEGVQESLYARSKKAESESKLSAAESFKKMIGLVEKGQAQMHQAFDAVFPDYKGWQLIAERRVFGNPSAAPKEKWQDGLVAGWGVAATSALGSAVAAAVNPAASGAALGLGIADLVCAAAGSYHMLGHRSRRTTRINWCWWLAYMAVGAFAIFEGVKHVETPGSGPAGKLDVTNWPNSTVLVHSGLNPVYDLGFNGAAGSTPLDFSIWGAGDGINVAWGGMPGNRSLQLTAAELQASLANGTYGIVAAEDGELDSGSVGLRVVDPATGRHVEKSANVQEIAPTPSVRPSPPPSNKPTVPPSPSSSMEPSKGPSASPSGSMKPSVPASPSGSVTPTHLPPSPSSSVTPTQLPPSPSGSVTPTPLTPSPSPSSSVTPTQLPPSPSASVTPTPLTPSPSSTHSALPSSSVTPTHVPPSASPSSSIEPSKEPSASPSASKKPSPTPTPVPFHIVPGTIPGRPGEAVSLCPPSGEGGACQAWTEADTVAGLDLSIPFGFDDLLSPPSVPPESDITVSGGGGSPWQLEFPTSTGLGINQLMAEVSLSLPGQFDGFAIGIDAGKVNDIPIAGQSIADVELSSLNNVRTHALRGLSEEGGDWQEVRGKKGQSQSSQSHTVVPRLKPSDDNPFAVLAEDNHANGSGKSRRRRKKPADKNVQSQVSGAASPTPLFSVLEKAGTNKTSEVSLLEAEDKNRGVLERLWDCLGL